jgi:hypothetical protein
MPSLIRRTTGASIIAEGGKRRRSGVVLIGVIQRPLSKGERGFHTSRSLGYFYRIEGMRTSKGGTKCAAAQGRGG